jgi:hypothetical protein
MRPLVLLKLKEGTWGRTIDSTVLVEAMVTSGEAGVVVQVTTININSGRLISDRNRGSVIRVTYIDGVCLTFSSRTCRNPFEWSRYRSSCCFPAFPNKRGVKL